MIPEIVSALAMMGVTAPIVQDNGYTRYELADSCYVEVVEYTDSTLVVETVCAPICSSHARVYYMDKRHKGNTSREVKPSIQGIFPYAYLDEHYQLHWQDNTIQIMDEEEKATITQR